MPYNTNKNLPKQVKDNLPKHGQDIYREAYNHAYEQYKNPEKRRGGENESKEETASKVAWKAVKSKYKKTKEGVWKRIKT